MKATRLAVAAGSALLLGQAGAHHGFAGRYG